MAKKKAKKDKKAPGFVPLFPGMTPPWDVKGVKKSRDAMAKKFAADMKSLLKQSIDLQKATADSAKEQFDQFFDYMTGLHEGFVSFLPDTAPMMPGMPVDLISPKDLAMLVKEFQELANSHLADQMDSHVDFIIVTQTKTVELIPELPEDEEAEEEETAAEEEAEEEAEADAVEEAIEEELEEVEEELEAVEEEIAEEELEDEDVEEEIEEAEEELAEEEIDEEEAE